MRLNQSKSKTRKRIQKRNIKIVRKVPSSDKTSLSNKISQYGRSILVNRIPENTKSNPNEDVKYVHYSNEWTNVKEVKGGIIITFDGRYLKILEVLPINYWQLDALRKETIINKFTTLSLASPSKFMLKMITDSVDINSVINHVKNVNKNVKNPQIKKAETDL